MIFPLFKKNMVSMIKPFIILYGVICMYTIVIIYMFNPELAAMLEDYQKALPEMMAACGMTGIATNLIEWIQIYLYGMIMHVFPLILALIMGNSLLMKYIDTGAIANLLATPHTRKGLIANQLVSGNLIMALLFAVVTVTGIVTCEVLFPGELDITRYCQLNAACLLLQLVILGIAFLAACVSSDSKTYFAFGAGIPIGFFLLMMISNMGGDVENLKYATIYTLFPAEKIVTGESGFGGSLIALAVVYLVLHITAAVWFTKRDLSV